MNHGHVTPNADGSKARCGGPGVCSECSIEQAQALRAPQVGEEVDQLCHNDIQEILEAFLVCIRRARAQSAAEIAEYREALEEMAEVPYKDSDLSSLLKWVQSRSCAVLYKYRRPT